ncbi:WhiB family transcriptional regulator [Glutamicibacter halophytocola]|uniref:WhiB family transcriptional regulator n=1 Tax=Glutamicibacter halophytocola TaxID=1933880 RepID=UPI0015592154|nr:WhiB family transcriptional regulator [Glutamicibacter halophytocola]NQD42672.1 WhiB family transcriptional regulator [Glutamicibacter halophytocola]
MATRSMASITRQAPKLTDDIATWQDQAACYPWDFKKHGDPFFPSSVSAEAANQAQSICSTCPVKAMCTELGYSDRDTFKYGIYGGTSPEDRTRSARKQGRIKTGRPRK